MIPKYAIRWSDNDRYFGPFTFSKDNKYKPLAIILGSGDNDEYPHCRLRISGFGFTFIVRLPPIIRPWKLWVDTSKYQWSNPNGGFWATGEREYGFSLHEKFLNVKFGRVTNDSTTDQRWGYFLPWMIWRLVRHSLCDLEGKHIFTQFHVKKQKYDFTDLDEMRAAREACPCRVFSFTDYDGEVLTATTRIEEREWRLGEGKFKWLSLFRSPKIDRSLDIHFSGEVGKRKGSWKGGMIGHSIEMLPGELHEQAFRRYCEQNNLIFGK